MNKKVNGSDQAIIGFNNHPLFSGMNLVGSWPLGFFISVGAFTYQKKSVQKFMRLLFPVRKLEKKISLSLSLSLKAPTALSPIYFFGIKPHFRPRIKRYNNVWVHVFERVQRPRTDTFLQTSIQT